jgi:hypothetical protein
LTGRAGGIHWRARAAGDEGVAGAGRGEGLLMDASRESTPPAGGWWRREGPVWGLLLALAVGECALVRRHVAAEVAPAFPGGFDQAVYLQRSYAVYERLRHDGAAAALRSALGDNPNSTLLGVFTQPFFLVLGANRGAALALNLFLFVALLVVTARTVSWRTGSPAAVALALGMLLLARTTFLSPGGGLADYRPDFGAYCLYGVLLAVAVRSGVFASLPWSLACGVAAAVTCLYRHVTLVYLAGAALATAAALLGGLLLAPRGGPAREGLRRRLRGLGAAAAVAAVLALPFFWAQRATIWGYYGVAGSAGLAVRVAEYGSQTWGDQLLYYPRQVLGVHGGRAFVGLAALAAAAGAAGTWSARRAGDTAAVRRAAPEWLLVAVGLAAPLAALTWGRTGMSPAVAGVLLPPLVWLAALGLGAARGRARRVVAAAALLALPAGAVQQWRHFGPARPARADQARLAELYDRVGDHCLRAGLAAPAVSTTHFCDYLHGTGLAVLYYERHGRMLAPEGRLGSVLFHVSQAEALGQLRASDVVLLSDWRPADRGAVLYPIEEDLLAWQGELRAVCAREFRPLCQARCFGHTVTAYVRPAGWARRPAR